MSTVDKIAAEHLALAGVLRDRCKTATSTDLKTLSAEHAKVLRRATRFYRIHGIPMNGLGDAVWTRVRGDAECVSQDAYPFGIWIDWTGGVMPVTRGTMVRVKYRNGTAATTLAEDLEWDHTGAPGDIVAFMTVAPAQAPDDGWITWDGGGVLPAPESTVEYKTRKGNTGDAKVEDIRWDHHSDRPGDIIAYRLLTTNR